MTTLDSPFKCLNCPNRVDPTSREVMHEVIGFTQPRKQGGANHVAFRKETGRYLCPECVVRWRHGHEGQGSLL